MQKANLKAVCVSGGKKCSFFRKFGVLYILVTNVLRFHLLNYYRRIYSSFEAQPPSIFSLPLSCQVPPFLKYLQLP